MAEVNVAQEVINTYNLTLSEKEVEGLFSLLYSGISIGAQIMLQLTSLRWALEDEGITCAYNIDNIIHDHQITPV